MVLQIDLRLTTLFFRITPPKRCHKSKILRHLTDLQTLNPLVEDLQPITHLLRHKAIITVQSLAFLKTIPLQTVRWANSHLLRSLSSCHQGKFMRASELLTLKFYRCIREFNTCKTKSSRGSERLNNLESKHNRSLRTVSSQRKRLLA